MNNKKQHCDREMPGAWATGWRALVALLLLGSINANAQSQLDQLIDKTISAYGGDKLRSLKTLKLVESYQQFDYGQSHHPSEVDREPGVFELSIDFTRRQKDFRWVMGDKTGFSTRHWLYDGRQGYRIGHATRSIAVSEGIDFAGVDRRYGQVLDTLLVKMLDDHRQSVAWAEKPLLDGKAVTFSTSDEQTFTLYIDPQTGYVMHMSRDGWQPGQPFIYHYANHRRRQGLAYAGDTYLTDAGEPRYVTRTREVQFNPAVADEFVAPTDYTALAKRLSFPDMVVNKLADNIYQAGKRWGFSIFIDAGEYFVAAGGYEGLTERFEAVKKASGIDKPLKYMVASHHHDDHLEGMNEAAQLGALFVAAADHVPSIRAVVEAPLGDDRFVTGAEFARRTAGLVKVVDYPSGHANHNLMTYVPAARLLFSADTYASRAESGAPNGHRGLKKLAALLNEKGVEVEQFAASHSPRILTDEDFRASLQKIVTPVCPADWQSCRMMRAR